MKTQVPNILQIYKSDRSVQYIANYPILKVHYRDIITNPHCSYVPH